MRTAKGFTLLELIIAMSIFATLAMLSVPSFGTWIANSQVRSVAEALQNGLNLSKAEAVKNNRSAQFSLTNGSPDATLAATPAASGVNWMIVNQPLLTGEGASFVQGGQFGSIAPNVAISGIATITFTPFGRVAATQDGTTTGTAVSFPVTYAVSIPKGDRPLNVIVTASGEVRLCDPAKSITSSPDGC